MRDDQVVRIVAAVMIVIGYGIRAIAVGNGTIGVFGWHAAPFALFLLAETTIALPELVDAIPIGPST